MHKTFSNVSQKEANAILGTILVVKFSASVSCYSSPAHRGHILCCLVEQQSWPEREI